MLEISIQNKYFKIIIGFKNTAYEKVTPKNIDC